MTCKQLNDGRCNLGKFGGKPKDYQCAVCPRYEGPDRGLGDKVHKLIKLTRVDRAAQVFETVSGKPCRCGERRAALNRLLPGRDS